MTVYPSPRQFINYEAGTKRPVSPHGLPINAHDPANWMSEAEARTSSPNVGFVLTDADPYFLLDIDKQWDPVTGEWSELARALCEQFAGAGIEVSQSGTGLHIIGRCDQTLLADRRNKWNGCLEFYTRGRYIALGPHGIQGDVDMDCTPLLLDTVPVRDVGAGVALKDGPSDDWNGPVDDDELIKRMLASRGSIAAQFGDKATVSQLWNADSGVLGKFYPAYGDDPYDRSSADAALMSHLAFWTGRDGVRMDRLFRRSGLIRDKYEKRKDYRESTVAGAVAGCVAVYSDPKGLVPAAASDLPEPDMSIVQNSETPPPELPIDVFGPWTDWITQAAEAKNASPDYVAFGLLAYAAVLIGNTRVASPWDDWSEPSILWVCLVGKPSTNKSPALDAINEPVSRIESEYGKDYKRQYADWKGKKTISDLTEKDWKAKFSKSLKEAETPPAKPESANPDEPPYRRRIRVSDATVESVVSLLEQNQRGLIVYRDEFAGWMDSMGRYNGGGDGAFWLEVYGGRSYSVDRKSSPEPIIVERCSVSIIGTTQPDRVQDLLMNGADDGMAARTLLIWPDPVPLKRPSTKIDKKIAYDAFCHLLALCPNGSGGNSFEPVIVEFDEAAREVLQAFRETVATWSGEYDGRISSHFGKFPGLVVRIALVLKYLDQAVTPSTKDDLKIHVHHIERATRLVKDYLKPMALRVYGDAGQPSQEIAACSLAKLILDEQLDKFSVREIVRKKRSHLKTTGDVRSAINILVECGWLIKQQSPTTGRPAELWLVNPKALGTG